jgi:periplasmic protein TonB
MRPTAAHTLILAAAAALAACERRPGPTTQPKLVSESTFQYPEELWDAGVEGETTLRIFISPRGTVDTAKVEQPSKYPAFDSAAIAGSRKLHFEPARRGGEAVGAWFRLPVQFRLSGGDPQPAQQP